MRKTADNNLIFFLTEYLIAFQWLNDVYVMIRWY